MLTILLSNNFKKYRIVANFYIPRLSNMTMSVQKNHLGGLIFTEISNFLKRTYLRKLYRKIKGSKVKT